MAPCSWKTLLLPLSIILTSSFPALVDAQTDTLPVFRVKSSYSGEAPVLNLKQNVFGKLDDQTSYYDSRFIVRAIDNSSTLEVDTISGGIWLADETRLWNITNPSTNISVEDPRASAESFIEKYGLLPTLNKPFSFAFEGISSSLLSQEETLNNDTHQVKVQEFQLDVSANYLVNLAVAGFPDPVPVVGGGGNFQVTLGDQGRLIGFHGVWRDVENEGVGYKIIPKDVSDEKFLNSTQNLKLVGFNSSLAYYSAPTGHVQNFLFPVYVYQATAVFGNETIQIRDTILPASDFGIERYDGCHEGRVTATSRSPDAKGQVRRRGLDDSALELGTEWLGVPWGLTLTQGNANGFTDVMLADRSASWRSSWDWGNSLVWESDFNAHDDTWVDAVDFTFYTGHANGNGWVANTPDSAFVDFAIVGSFPETPGDLWGQKDLEWLIIAACGPHQDDRIVAGGGNAFDRWRGAFDGLHIMLAYATNTADTAEEGRRFATYAQQGKTVIQSWFQTAKEVQTKGVWVTAMWASTPGNDISQDHLPGHGFVGVDPVTTLGQTRWLMWTQV